MSTTGLSRILLPTDLGDQARFPAHPRAGPRAGRRRPAGVGPRAARRRPAPGRGRCARWPPSCSPSGVTSTRPSRTPKRRASTSCRSPPRTTTRPPASSPPPATPASTCWCWAPVGARAWSASSTAASPKTSRWASAASTLFLGSGTRSIVDGDTGKLGTTASWYPWARMPWPRTALDAAVFVTQALGVGDAVVEVLHVGRRRRRPTRHVVVPEGTRFVWRAAPVEWSRACSPKRPTPGSTSSSWPRAATTACSTPCAAAAPSA